MACAGSWAPMSATANFAPDIAAITRHVRSGALRKYVSNLL